MANQVLLGLDLRGFIYKVRYQKAAIAAYQKVSGWLV